MGNKVHGKRGREGGRKGGEVGRHSRGKEGDEVDLEHVNPDILASLSSF